MPQLFALLSSSPVGGHRSPWGARTWLARAGKVFLMRFSRYTLYSLLLPVLGLGAARAIPSDTVTQTITIRLDKRYGLHLHNNTWTVNLGGTGTTAGSSVATSNCYRAGEHDKTTGRDVLYTVGVNPSFLNLFNFAQFSGDTLKDSDNPYSQTVNLKWYKNSAQTTPETRIVPVSSYPGFEFNGSAVAWKGPIMCVLNTTLEVFSNGQQAAAGNGISRSRVQASLSTPSANFPKLVLNVSNAITGRADAAFVTPNSLSSPTVLGTRRDAQRWTDFPLIQALVFDGTETSASSGTATLALTLADFTPVP